MEAGSVFNSSSSAYVLSFNSPKIRTKSISNFPKTSSGRFSYGTTSPQFARLRSSPITIGQVVQNPAPDSLTKLMLPKIDKNGRFCSPRAARELALLILYAACLDGSDPVRLFEKRLNARRETGYEFDTASLREYDHMSFAGPPVTTETAEEADEILRNNQKESDIGRILEFSVLHLAMTEIAVLGTRHQIVFNEAVDLAKRFCDGAAPRIINGCLRTFVRELNQYGEAENVKIKQVV